MVPTLVRVAELVSPSTRVAETVVLLVAAPMTLSPEVRFLPKSTDRYSLYAMAW